MCHSYCNAFVSFFLHVCEHTSSLEYCHCKCFIQFHVFLFKYFFLQTSTFPPENCLDINAVKLVYQVTFSNDVSTPIKTLNNSVEVIVHQPMEFEITITPTLPDLGLSGSPYSTTVGQSVSLVYKYVHVHVCTVDDNVT